VRPDLLKFKLPYRKGSWERDLLFQKKQRKQAVIKNVLG
jgi:hypothetical protein